MNIANSTELICFIVLGTIVIVGALGVVFLNNIVYSAFLLGGVFMSVAGLYLLLNASFVAAAQILVYVGAVNFLILFAIMLVNKREELKPIKGLQLRRILSGLVCSGLLIVRWSDCEPCVEPLADPGPNRPSPTFQPHPGSSQESELL